MRAWIASNSHTARLSWWVDTSHPPSDLYIKVNRNWGEKEGGHLPCFMSMSFTSMLASFPLPSSCALIQERAHSPCTALILVKNKVSLWYVFRETQTARRIDNEKRLCTDEQQVVFNSRCTENWTAFSSTKKLSFSTSLNLSSEKQAACLPDPLSGCLYSVHFFTWLNESGYLTDTCLSGCQIVVS